MQLTGGFTLSGGMALSVPSGIVDEIIGVGVSLTPYVQVYNFRSDTGFGTKFGNPSTPIGSAASGFTFSPAKDAVLLSVDVSPFIEAYQFNTTTGFGTKYSNPSPAAAVASGTAVSINPAGTQVIVGGSGSPFVASYAWTFASGFGTKYADPSSAYVGENGGVGVIAK